MKPFHLIITAYCDDEYADPQPSYAIIGLDLPFVLDMISKIKRTERLRKTDGNQDGRDLYRMTYWDCRPQWVFELPWNKDESDESLWPTDLLTGESLLSLVDERELFAVIDVYLPEELPHYVRPEVVTVEASHEDAAWRGYIKHTSYCISTEPVSLEQWERLSAMLTDRAPTWSHEDGVASNKQGWGIFHTGDRYEIEKIDCPNEVDAERIFTTDDEAAAFLQQQANAGDDLAKRAIEFLIYHGSPDVTQFHLTIPKEQ